LVAARVCTFRFLGHHPARRGIALVHQRRLVLDFHHAELDARGDGDRVEEHHLARGDADVGDPGLVALIGGLDDVGARTEGRNGVVAVEVGGGTRLEDAAVEDRDVGERDAVPIVVDHFPLDLTVGLRQGDGRRQHGKGKGVKHTNHKRMRWFGWFWKPSNLDKYPGQLRASVNAARQGFVIMP
jgi:hypothetical protein